MVAISLKSLASRATRELVGDKGTRVIETGLSFSDAGQGPDGIIGKIIDKVFRGAGWLTEGLFGLAKWGLSKINFGRIWGWLVNRAARLAVFDWNQTDIDIANLQRGNTVSMFAIWGSATGSTLG